MKRLLTFGNTSRLWFQALFSNIKKLQRKEKIILTLLLLGICVLIAGIITGTLLLFNINKGTYGACNIANGGKIIVANQTKYAVHYTDGKIYCLEKDTPAPLSDINFCRNLIEKDGYLYFLGGVEIGTQGIYKLNLSNGTIERICTGIFKKFEIYYNWIYFIAPKDDGGQLSKIRLDGSRRQELSKTQVSDFFIFDHEIYLCNADDNGRLYKINLNGTSPLPLEEIYPASMCVFQKNIFYIDAKTKYLTKCNLSGKEQTTVIKEKCAVFNCYEKQVYYTIENQKGIFVSDNAANTTKLAEAEQVKDFYFWDSTMYFYTENASLKALDINTNIISELL